MRTTSGELLDRAKEQLLRESVEALSDSYGHRALLATASGVVDHLHGAVADYADAPGTKARADRLLSGVVTLWLLAHSRGEPTRELEGVAAALHGAISRAMEAVW